MVRWVESLLWLVIWWILLLWYLYRFVYLKKTNNISIFADAIQDIVNNKTNRTSFLHGTRMGVIVLFSLLLAQPYIKYDDTPVLVSSHDIVLVLDVSKSMQADDFDPDRLSVAKSVIIGFLDTLWSERIGLVVFAGKSFTWLPLTRDYEFIKETVQSITTDTINQNLRSLQWTATWEWILSAIRLYEQQPEQEKAKQKNIILITDGEVTPWTINPILTSKLAKEKNIKIFTVWIGSEAGGSFLYSGIWWTARIEVPWIDEESLREIARWTEAKYRRANTQEVFVSIFEEIVSENLKEYKEETLVPHAPFWKPFVVGLCILLSVLFIHSWLLSSAYGTTSILLSILILFWSIFPWEIRSMEKINERTSYDAMIMLDVSKSMGVQDMNIAGALTQRLTYPKQHIKNLMNEYPQWRFGLGVFAGSAIGVLPLTSDHELFKSFLDNVDDQYDGLIEPGTSLSKALNWWMKRFVDNESWVLLVFSDGGEVWEEGAKTEKGSKGEEPQAQSVLPILIWVWSEIWWPIPSKNDIFWSQQYVKYEGETVISALNEEAMRDLGLSLWARYIWTKEELDLDWLIDEYGIGKNLFAEAWVQNQSLFSRWLILVWGWLFLMSLLLYLKNELNKDT